MRGFPRIWNDWLALLILIGVPVLWVTGVLNEVLIGVTSAGWTLVVQFYFRRAPAEKPGGGTDN